MKGNDHRGKVERDQTMDGHGYYSREHDDQKPTVRGRQLCRAAADDAAPRLQESARVNADVRVIGGM